MLRQVYIETSLVSYLTARPSRDVVIAGHQQITQEWWDTCRGNFEICASQLVIQEAGAGDPHAAKERLEILADMKILPITNEASNLAKELVKAGALPNKAQADALHIAIASVHAVPFLLTWNCRHMANATMRSMIEVACGNQGFTAPIICTPEELMETKQ